jgi:hypothetical protein
MRANGTAIRAGLGALRECQWLSRGGVTTRSGSWHRTLGAHMKSTELQPRFAKVLAGFAPGSADALRSPQTSVERTRFPVPELLLVLLREILGFPWSGTGEKVRWTIYFDVAGKAFAIELAKFGLRLYYPAGDTAAISRVLGQLEAALGKLEKLMQPYAEERIRTGNVTLANRSSHFRGRYEFFRSKAQTAYRAANRRRPGRRKVKSPDDQEGGVSSIFEEIFKGLEKENHGFFYSVAMVDAYFSYLEHQLVLLRAFQGTALGPTTVAEILAARWDDKLRLVLGKDAVTHAKLVGEMRQLKERIRNPFAHGGVENDGGSIYFHVPGVGVIPGNMSRTRTSTHFKWIPVEAPDHDRACALFDSLDQVLQAGRLKRAARIVEAGVDAAWDRDSMAQYRRLNRQSEATLERWLKHWGETWTRHANMDY